MRKTLLISSFACSPNIGSEFYVSWSYLQNISKYHDVIAFVGTTNTDLISYNSDELIIPGVEFHKVSMTYFGMFLHYLSCRLRLVWFWPLCLRSWNRSVFREAKKIIKVRKIDLVHQLNPIGFKNPGNLWRLPIKSYWGPVGGFLRLNTEIASKQGFKYKLITSIWNFLNFLSSKDFFISRAAHNYTSVSFSTSETRDNFEKIYGVTGPIIPEVCTDEDLIDKARRLYKPNQVLKLACIGSLTWRKNIQQILDALKQLQAEYPEYHVQLNIFGDGPLMSIIRNKSKSLSGSTNVILHGNVDRKIMLEQLINMDSIIVTSLAEGNSAAVLEAVSLGLVPIVPFAHGFKTTLCEAALFYEQNSSYDDQIKQIVNHIKFLVNIENRIEARSNVLNMATKITFGEVINLHRKIIESEINHKYQL